MEMLPDFWCFLTIALTAFLKIANIWKSTNPLSKPDVERRATQYIWRSKMNNPKESLWIRCPICDGKTRTKVYADTVLVNFPLFCPKCKKEIRIDVVQLKMVISKWARRKNAEPASLGHKGSRLCFYPIGVAFLSRRAATTDCNTGMIAAASSSLQSSTSSLSWRREGDSLCISG